jgi:DNA-binding CsgD family transcriptional regulator
MPANRGMRGELYAIRALALAVLGRQEESQEWSAKAQSLSTCVEARAYSACAASVLALDRGAPPAKIAEILGEVCRMGEWDAFVSAMRASPGLLVALSDAGLVEPRMVAALRRSYDFDLSRQAGVDIGRRPRGGPAASGLSPREREVLELIGQGLSNEAIARALFISKSTVKVHVSHILEKTGARSRTQAATAGDS